MHIEKFLYGAENLYSEPKKTSPAAVLVRALSSKDLQMQTPPKTQDTASEPLVERGHQTPGAPPAAGPLGPAQQLEKKHLGCGLRTSTAVKQPGEIVVEGCIFEVLVGFGLAHLQTRCGAIYGMTPSTPGIEHFGTIQVGQHYRCVVTAKFARIQWAELVD